MRASVLALLFLALFLGLGRQISRRPPVWLLLDPIAHPFGLDRPADSGAEAKAGEDGPPLVSPEHPLDINRASARELTALPRVGPVLAGRIIALRDSLGAFVEMDQLLAVRGVGARTLEGLRPLVRLQSVP